MTEGNEQRIAAVVASLPVGDKATITAGRSLWETAELPPIGLRSMLLSDGPLGVRGPDFDGRNTSLCLPSTSALAATWDPALAERVGQVIAGEAIRLGVQVVLGPMVNLHRTPLGGRVFESFSEDPLLTGRLARSWVFGVQGRGVGATAKHFIANDAEQGRLKADCHVSERALRELYLVPFEMLVEAGVWAVMVAYNGLDGTPLTRHQDLLRRVLKDEWGFDGVVMSDWYAQSDTVVSANAGLDLEMPGPGRAFGPELAEAVSSGRCREAVLDDMAARMLRLAVRAGCLQDGRHGWRALGGGSPRDAGGEDEAAVLLDAAVGGMTLLRNNGILPLAAAATRIAVIGPAAVDPAYMGGGSAQVLMEPAPTPAEAIMRRFGRPGARRSRAWLCLAPAGGSAGAVRRPASGRGAAAGPDARVPHHGLGRRARGRPRGPCDQFPHVGARAGGGSCGRVQATGNEGPADRPAGAAKDGPLGDRSVRHWSHHRRRR